MEFFIQVIIEVLFVAPGAFIRWCFLKSDKSFADVLNEDNPYNYVLSWLLIIPVILSITCLSK